MAGEQLQRRGRTIQTSTSDVEILDGALFERWGAIVGASGNPGKMPDERLVAHQEIWKCGARTSAQGRQALVVYGRTVDEIGGVPFAQTTQLVSIHRPQVHDDSLLGLERTTP